MFVVSKENFGGKDEGLSNSKSCERSRGGMREEQQWSS